MERFGTRLVALDDWGDDSHEGELLKYMKGWVSEGERLRTAERTRRGKLQKAREGKVLAGRTPSFGFRYNTARDNYEVDEETMPVVARVFREVGAEGKSMNSVRMAFNREQVRPPLGGRFWSAKKLRDIVTDDVYRAHTYEEVAALVSPQVASRLDREKLYGIWWFNRRRYETRQVAVNAPGGRQYRRQGRLYDRPRSEWVAVPVPDSGIPREWVDRAREGIKDNAKPSANADRVWELSGGFLVCAECGCRMGVHTTIDHKTDRKNGGRKYFYYRCWTRRRHGVTHVCANKRHHRAENAEAAVWELVSGLLKDPDRLRAGLEELIEQELAAMRGDPGQEAAAWLEKLAEVDQERRGYLRLAAKGHMTDQELDEELRHLDDTRTTAETALRAIQGRKEAREELGRDRDALLESYTELTYEALEGLTPEERREVYRMLRLNVMAAADGTMEVRGVLSENIRDLQEYRQSRGESLCENELAPPCTTCSRSTA